MLKDRDEESGKGRKGKWWIENDFSQKEKVNF